MKTALTLPQALFLLARDDATGKPLGNHNSFIQPAGALAELIMSDRLALRAGRMDIVEVVDTATTGSTYLDTILGELAASKRPRRVQYWVSLFHGRRNRIGLIGNELVAKRIVEKVPAKYLGLFPVTRWRALKTAPKRQLISAMEKTLFNEANEPSERIGTIIALANSGHLLKRNFDRTKLSIHKRHIKRIAKGGWPASTAIIQAITTLRTAITAGIFVSSVSGGR